MIFRRESCILRLGSLIDVNCCDSGPSAVLILSFLQGPGFHPGACPGVSFCPNASLRSRMLRIRMLRAAAGFIRL
jgi:hypothetical protein